MNPPSRDPSIEHESQFQQRPPEGDESERRADALLSIGWVHYLELGRSEFLDGVGAVDLPDFLAGGRLAFVLHRRCEHGLVRRHQGRVEPDAVGETGQRVVGVRGFVSMIEPPAGSLRLCLEALLFLAAVVGLFGVIGFLPVESKRHVGSRNPLVRQTI